jgi:hypothetical protein
MSFSHFMKAYGSTAFHVHLTIVLAWDWGDILVYIVNHYEIKTGTVAFSLPRQTPRSLFNGVGDSRILSTYFDLSIICPLFLSDFKHNWIMSVDFSKTVQHKLSRRSKICDDGTAIQSLSFWRLPIVPSLFISNVSETGLCLRPHIISYSVGPNR